MRKWNAILSMAILLLFLLHAIAGGFQLAGLIPGGNRLLTIFARIMVVLIVIHAAIGTKLTVDSLNISKRAGVSYWKENRLFWVRRISGIAVMVFILAHVVLFLGTSSSGAYLLRRFEGAQLASQILMVNAVAVHVLTNIRPLFLALGARRVREILVDVLLVLSVILLFAGAMFVVYYLRWSVI